MTQAEPQGDTALPDAPRKRPSRTRIAITFAVVIVVAVGAFVGTQAFLRNNPFTSTHSADCKTAEASLLAVTVAMQAMQAMQSDASSDPAAVIDKLDGLAVSMDSAVAKMSDAKVKASVQAADDSLKTVTTTLKSMAADPASADMAKLTSELTTTEDAFQSIDRVCK